MFFVNGYIPFVEMALVSHVYTVLMVVAGLCAINLLLVPVLTAIFVHAWVEGVDKVEGVLSTATATTSTTTAAAASRGGAHVGREGNSSRNDHNHAVLLVDPAKRVFSAEASSSFSCADWWRALFRACDARRRGLPTQEWIRLCVVGLSVWLWLWLAGALLDG